MAAKKPPKYFRLELNVDPYRSIAAMAVSIQGPDGYQFFKMTRKGTKAKVTFIRTDCLIKDED